MAEDARWRVGAGQQHIDVFDLNVSTPQVEPETLVKLHALLAQLGAIHERIGEAITRDFGLCRC